MPGHIAEEEAVRDPRRRAGLAGTADVLDDPDVAVVVVLDALVAPAAERSGNVLNDRWVARRGRVGRCGGALRREQQPLCPRVPGRAVDGRERRARRVRGREQRDAVRGVRVEVDPRDVARGPGLVALEEEVRAVPVVRVGAGEALLEDEVGVLVRLGLVGLVGHSRGRHHLRIARGRDDVVVVAVIRDLRRRVLDLRRALCDGHLGQLRRELARRCESHRPRVRGRDVGEPKAASERRRARGERADRDRPNGSEHGNDRSPLAASHELLLPCRRAGGRAGAPAATLRERVATVGYGSVRARCRSCA